MIFQKIKKIISPLKNSIVLQNLFLVSFITFLIKGLGFYKETMVAANFGLSEVLDTFFIAILVPTFINNVFLGAYRSVFVPNYISELKNNGNKGSFQSTSFLITIVLGIIFMIIAYLTTDVFLEQIYPSHDNDYYNLVKEQFYIMLPCVMFWGLASLLGGLLNIANEYRLSTFANIFTPVTVIVCLTFFKELMGTNVLALGTLLGSFLSLLYLYIIAVRKKILFFDLPDFQNKNIQILFKQIPAKVSSGLLTGLNPVIDQFFAAQLIIGSIAAINYGLKIPAFFAGLVTIAISNVLLPYFSNSIHNDRKKAFANLFKALKIVFGSVSVLALAGVFWSEEIVSLLFERKEFTSKDSQIVSSIQQVFLIYLPFAISGMLMVNFLTSINKNSIMAYTALVALGINFLLDYILMQYYGILGIAFSTTVVAILKNTFTFFYIYNIKKKEIATA
ncbi:murein biosynthesis integral membrane protein MurJ [Zobellia laminariae]|uniref:murein biosynthesis integral membrane protein MurJ n=1 Tax=Zobellia laminariae TaxID=248906 RepID=UPI0026F42A56|nr:lipid II flippase MurJ [Zobellia laminariae]WKX76461.1 lipid II flippase MurJ [Zobellia laminariae]